MNENHGIFGSALHLQKKEQKDYEDFSHTMIEEITFY